MVSGLQEVLLIVAILLAILFVPRMLSPKRRSTPKPVFQMHRLLTLSVRWRLALAVTLLWMLGTAFYFKPWREEAERFLLFGIGPVLIGWCTVWVVSGLRPRRKN